MKDGLNNLLRDWLTMFLTGMGITFATNQWVGGMFLALAGAAYAMNTDPEKDQRELVIVLIGAFLVAHLVSLAEQKWAPDLPVQFVMGIAGFLSRRIIGASLKVAGLIETKSDRVADNIIDRVIPTGTGGFTVIPNPPEPNPPPPSAVDNTDDNKG